MAQGAYFCFPLCLLLIAACVSSSENIPLESTQHDELVYPTTPITVLPANNPPPAIITVPSTTTPVTNPVTTYPPPTSGVPATNPVVTPGQRWCVLKNGVSEASIQTALDYACGVAGADCMAIQQGKSCYNPNSLQNHASYALNSYFQKNPVQTSCDFGGIGMITTTNPSSGTCIYTTSSASSSSPSTATTPSPTTTSSGGGSVYGSVTPPSMLNSSNPASVDGTSTSRSINLQPLMGFTVLAISTVTGRFIIYM